MSTLLLLVVQGADAPAADIVAVLRAAGLAPVTESVSDPDALREALGRREWDVIVSDHRLEGLDAFATLTIVSRSGRDIPVIAITDDIDPGAAVRLIRAGADDYIQTSHLGRLAPAIERELLQKSSRRERQQGEARQRAIEAQLAQALKMESVGRLAGGVAHDFNNQLAVMIGWADLARAGLSDDDDLRPALDEILEAGSRARDLVRQLLALGRRDPLELAPIDLNAVVAAAVADFQAALPPSIDLTTTLAPELGSVEGDATQLAEVVTSLATNARDAMGTCGRLRIETANVLVGDEASAGAGVPPGAYVLLTVADSGPGMDTEPRTRAFDPFFSTKYQGHRAGPGLSAVYGIVQQHGGHVRVRSDDGNGSTSSIYLPRTTDTHPSTDVQTKADRRRDAATVMVVEDEPAVRSLVARMLTNGGYRVVEAEDGTAAVRLAGELPTLDLLVSDVMLPGLNGPQVRERIAALHPGCRVLFISGYPDNVLGEHAVLVAGRPFLEKPFTVGELTDKVRQVLDA